MTRVRHRRTAARSEAAAAWIEDVHALALGMPLVSVEHGTGGNQVYRVGGKSFVFFRNPRPEAP